MALTGLLSIVFTGLGLLYTGPLSRAIGVPEDVPSPFFSISDDLFLWNHIFTFYNMGSGILRAVGTPGIHCSIWRWPVS